MGWIARFRELTFDKVDVLVYNIFIDIKESEENHDKINFCFNINGECQYICRVNFKKLNVSTYDLTVILGNLLDNAITAIKKADIKLLDLSISCSMGNLIIILRNSYNGILKIENHEFITSKNNKENHGIGISNIKKSLENYDGEIRIEYTKDIFTASVIIPYIN